MTTTNMSLNEPSVGVTTGPDWATQVNENFETIDTHDHTSGKGVQLTPSALNINADLEFNSNAAIELKRLTFDSGATGSGTNYSVYQQGGNLYWYNGSGQAVQITNGASVKTTGGSIDGMSGTDAQVLFGSGIYRFEFDTTLTPFSGSKMAHADILLYKYDGSTGSDAYVILKYTGSSAGSNNITVPDETGTMLTTSTSFGGNISIAATGGSNTITLDAEGDINLDSDSGVINFKDGGTAIGKISNSSSDLVIENEVDAKDIIFKQYDGNEVVRMADDRRLYFFDKGGEYIVGDGTDLTIASGGALNLTATTDVVVPANVGVTFGTGEKIEGDNTDLTITSGADINLTATADVNLPNNVGLVFGDDGEKIEGDGTDLTIASSGEININSGTLDLSAQTVDVTLNNAVDALNFDSNTLSIDASNNRIGIGTAAPSETLTVAQGTTERAIAVCSSDANVGGFIGTTGESGTSNKLVINGSRGSGAVIFQTVSSEAMRINSSGLVGIGTNGNPSAELELKGSSNPEFRFSSTDSTDPFIYFGDETDVVKAGIGLDSSENALVLRGYNNISRLSIDSSGNVEVNTGNLVIGTAGQGIDFSAQTATSATGANTTAELLDHYEEGTWTPTNYTGGSVLGARYTKIGRLVTVSVYLANVTSFGLTIGGLPFNSLSYGVGSIAYSNSANLDGITTTGSNIQFRQSNSSVTPNGSHIMMSVTYQT